MAALLCLALPAAVGQVSDYGSKTEGPNVGDQLPTILKNVQVTQHLGAQLPLGAKFVDSTGKPVTLGQYFDGKHPVIITTVYYNCPMLCPEEMDGLTSALMMVNLKPGRDFQIVIISIDPSEKPPLAAKNKALYLKRYGHPGSAAGWHFLTGEKPAIDAVTKAIGFGYVRVPGPDGKMTQFAHASSIQIATPQGKLAQYYLGVEYSPKDLLLGLVESSNSRIGSPVANILTYCYSYDPQIDRHSLMVVRVVQMGGIVTMAGLGSFIFLSFRRDLRLSREDELQQGGRTRRRNG